ncbi:MAG: hypothetical protein H6812_13040 [Phycisphaeraceae bacterium]|nr:hypothetical protein [Phycisphaerales bacterium]MCB9844163.1 hypothetical protein [Phycisphaeraceae bacterium]
MNTRYLAALACAMLIGAFTPAARAITEDQVLLLYNSQNADSLAVRNMYVALYPGVRQFDFNDATIPTQFCTRFEYNSKIRLPLLNFINGVSAPFQDISSDVVVFLTTRGLPTRINGGAEFSLATSFSSVESELTLIQQDLEVAGNTALPFRYNGVIDNPYHLNNTVPVTNFTRANIKQPKNFTIVGPTGGEHWYITNLTTGDFYLTCRLDAQPYGTTTALQNIQALLNRSQHLVVSKCMVQCLFDEYQPSANQLDDDDLPPRFPLRDDFEKATQFLTNQGYAVTHDETTNFITGPELPDNRPILVLGSYGENHDIAPGAENAPGDGEYLDTYTFDPAAIFVSYESFNAHDIAGQSGSDHEQVTDFIARGGSFTVGHVAEPFTVFVADAEYLARALYLNGRTFAEAAWIATPALSITNVPIGDPLATVTVVDTFLADVVENGTVDVDDLNAILSNWQVNVGVGDRLDVANNDGVINVDDLNVILAAWQVSCP